jgi:predicted MFS family arabinose efflux permease
MVLYFAIQLGTGVVPPLLPEIKKEFGLTLAQAALVGTAFSLSRLVLDLPLGIIVQRVNKNGLIVTSIISVGLGALLSAQAQSFPQLLLGRVIVGIGVATFMITSFLKVLEFASAESRGRIVTVYNASGSIAYCVFAPGIAGLIGARAGWRMAFWFSVGAACTALLIVVGTLMLKRRRGEGITGPSHGNTQATTTSLWRGISSISSGKLWLVNSLTLVFSFHFTGFVGTMAPLYLSESIGAPVDTIGLLLSAQAIIDVVASLFAGVLFDRFNRRAVLIPGMLVMGVASGLMVISDKLMPAAICLLVMSVGRSTAMLPVALLADVVPKEHIGTALGLNRLIDDIGLTLGPIVLSWIAGKTGFLGAGFVVGLMAWLTAAVLGIFLRRIPDK